MSSWRSQNVTRSLEKLDLSGVSGASAASRRLTTIGCGALNIPLASTVQRYVDLAGNARCVTDLSPGIGCGWPGGDDVDHPEGGLWRRVCIRVWADSMISMRGVA
jgi:hypothetical protein